MNLKHALFGIVTAAALTGGLVSSAVAQTQENTTAALDSSGITTCGVTTDITTNLSFGTYLYTSTGYFQSGSRSSTADFTVTVTTDTSPTNCHVTVSGTNLLKNAAGPEFIPVGLIALAQNGGSIAVENVSSLTSSDQNLVRSVGPTGNGAANVRATLTLTPAEDTLPNDPNYQGTITLTGTTGVAP